MSVLYRRDREVNLEPVNILKDRNDVTECSSFENGTLA